MNCVVENRLFVPINESLHFMESSILSEVNFLDWFPRQECFYFLFRFLICSYYLSLEFVLVFSYFVQNSLLDSLILPQLPRCSVSMLLSLNLDLYYCLVSRLSPDYFCDNQTTSVKQPVSLL